MNIRTVTADEVLEMVTDPAVWPWLECDEMRPEKYIQGDWTHIGCDDGFMAFTPVTTGGECFAHIVIRRRTVCGGHLAHACLEEMRRRGARKFLAPICDWNRAALRLARRCGFAESRRIDGICHRAGVPHQVILLESK